MVRYANIAYATQDLRDQDGMPLGLWTPMRSGLVAWTMDPANTSNATTVTLGSVHLMPLLVPADGTINTLSCVCSGTGTTPANTFMGIYDVAGNLLRGTADFSGVLGSTGQKDVALTASLALVAGGVYYAALLHNAAASVQFRMGYNSAAASMGTIARFLKTTATGLTALPNPLGSVQTGTFPLLIGAS